VVLLPSSPYALSPQAQTAPFEPNAKLWAQPLATVLTPERPLTCTAVEASVVAPLPSCRRSWSPTLPPNRNRCRIQEVVARNRV
jgi:hypothetical protein